MWILNVSLLERLLLCTLAADSNDMAPSYLLSHPVTQVLWRNGVLLVKMTSSLLLNLKWTYTWFFLLSPVLCAFSFLFQLSLAQCISQLQRTPGVLLALLVSPPGTHWTYNRDLSFWQAWNAFRCIASPLKVVAPDSVSWHLQCLLSVKELLWLSSLSFYWVTCIWALPKRSWDVVALCFLCLKYQDESLPVTEAYLHYVRITLLSRLRGTRFAKVEESRVQGNPVRPEMQSQPTDRPTKFPRK